VNVFWFITSQGRSNREGGGGEGMAGAWGGAKLQVNCKFRHIKTLFFDRQNSVKAYPKSRKWHFRDSKFKNFFGPSFLAPNQKEIRTALHASVIRLCVKYAYFCL
jgi:hypothetical protein